MSEKTTKKVIEIIAEFKEDAEEEISVETSLKEMDLDSLDALNLVFEMEEAFDITIPDDKAFEMNTVGEMVEGIDKLLELKEKEEAGDSAKAEG